MARTQSNYKPPGQVLIHQLKKPGKGSKATPSVAQRVEELLAYATKVRATARDWTALHNAVFGVGAKFQQLFPTEAERIASKKTKQLKEIWKMIGELRGDDASGATAGEDTQSGKFLVRIPKSLHAALTTEAAQEDVSLNQLVLAKLTLNLGSTARERVKG